MALSAGDILTYNGTSWVNQPAVAGNFGIGLTTPQFPLEIDWVSGVTGIYLKDTGGGQYTPFIMWDDASTPNTNTFRAAMRQEGTIFVIGNWPFGGSFTTYFTMTSGGSTIIGSWVALANAATSGFLYLPTVAGTPTGVPTAVTGKVAVVYDTTANKLWVYNGAWKSAAFT